MSGFSIALRCGFAIFFLSACKGGPLFGDSKMTLAAREKIDQIFKGGVPVCFGRFVLTVPKGTEIGFGESSAAGVGVEVLDWPVVEIDQRVEAEAKKLRLTKHETEPGGLLRHIEQILQPTSWIIAYRGSEGDIWGYDVKSYLAVGKYALMLSGGTDVGQGSYEPEVERLRAASRRFLPRETFEVPQGPGFCMEDLFVKDDGSPGQEIVRVGLVFPQWPDVQVSMIFNRDADPERYFGEDLLTRMGRLEYANDEIHPQIHDLVNTVKVLRKGKAEIGNWKGQEWLGTITKLHAHQFYFEAPHEAGNPFKPNMTLEFNSGIHNGEQWGAKPSLSDEEAIALYEHLLRSIQAREAPAQ